MSDYNYKCPKCGGEFETWDGGTFSKKKCPFCGQRKGSFGVSL